VNNTIEDEAPAVEILANFQRLETRLENAVGIYLTSDNEGRSGALAALEAAADFIASVPRFRAKNLVLPLVKLSAELLDVSGGTPSPMLTPVKKAGRPPQRRCAKAMHAYVAATVELMYGLGESPMAAARRIYRHLSAQFEMAEGTKTLTAATFAEWRERASSGSYKDDFDTQVYRDFLLEWEGTVSEAVDTASAQRVARDLLNRLTRVVGALRILAPIPVNPPL
jgi:hypothetical protein